MKKNFLAAAFMILSFSVVFSLGWKEKPKTEGSASNKTIPDGKTHEAETEVTGENAGHPFYSLVFTDMNGKKVSGKELCEGNDIVVVNCFATWCPPCMAEIPSLVSMHGNLPESVALIGVSFDMGMTPLQLQGKLNKFGVTYPVYFPGENFDSFFNTEAIPDTLFVGGNGVLLDAVVGAPRDPEKFFLERISNLLER